MHVLEHFLIELTSIKTCVSSNSFSKNNESSLLPSFLRPSALTYSEIAIVS